MLNNFIEILEKAVNGTDYAKTMAPYYPDKQTFAWIERRLGKKFDRIFYRDHSGSHYIKYFVERSTGNIYGANSITKPNFNRQYGTLATVGEWDWSGYYAESLNGVDSLVPKENRRKA